MGFSGDPIPPILLSRCPFCPVDTKKLRGRTVRHPLPVFQRDDKFRGPIIFGPPKIERLLNAHHACPRDQADVKPGATKESFNRQGRSGSFLFRIVSFAVVFPLECFYTVAMDGDDGVHWSGQGGRCSRAIGGRSWGQVVARPPLPICRPLLSAEPSSPPLQLGSVARGEEAAGENGGERGWPRPVPAASVSTFSKRQNLWPMRLTI